MPPLPSTVDPPRFSEDIDSSCSTPYVSAPSSPGHAPSPSPSPSPSGYFFSAPASPIHHFLLSTGPHPSSSSSDSGSGSGSFEFEFEFSSRFSPNGSSDGLNSMTSADELFFNGQIRPMKLSSHLRRPQESASLDDADEAGVYGRGRDFRLKNRKFSHHRKARSMSPFRGGWDGTRTNAESSLDVKELKENENMSSETTPSCSSSGRNSKKWIFLKDLLHRSKSEGRANNKDRFWSAISFSPAKEKRAPASSSSSSSSSPSPALSPSSSRDEKKGKNEVKRGGRVANGKPTNGIGKRRVPPSAHELHYTANRAQAEELKKKTFLPYRQGLLGCLGFSSKSYGAFTGFTRNLNPISSR